MTSRIKDKPSLTEEENLKWEIVKTSYQNSENKLSKQKEAVQTG